MILILSDGYSMLEIAFFLLQSSLFSVFTKRILIYIVYKL